MSPITDFGASTESTKANSKKDWLNQDSIPTWGNAYAGHKERDVYINPGSASEEWWNEAKVKQTIVCYGEYELPKDSIETWAKKFKVSHAQA